MIGKSLFSNQGTDRKGAILEEALHISLRPARGDWVVLEGRAHIVPGMWPPCKYKDERRCCGKRLGTAITEFKGLSERASRHLFAEPSCLSDESLEAMAFHMTAASPWCATDSDCTFP